MNQNDPHHCQCFSVDEFSIDEFRQALKEIGFKDTIWQEDHGQEFGLILRLDEYTQMHVKVFDDGKIESEIEYPPDYPVAHINQKHSYSAHHQLKEVFKVIKINHKSKLFPPFSCLRPKIIPAINPSHAKTIAGGMIALGIIGALVYVVAKEIRKE